MAVVITISRYLLLYLIIISGSIFIADKANKKIEKCIAPNMAIIILELYIFGMFEILKYGVWIIGVTNILLGIYTIIKNWKTKHELKEKVLTSGFICFSIIFLILMITTYNKNLLDYDHYLYRSFNTKVMYYTDCISKGFQALYPPGINLLEYFFMKILGIYVQGVEAFAVQILGFSLLMPLFDRKQNTKFINWIITILVICIPAILGNLIFYEGAYPDALLGLIIGYSMYILLTEANSKFKVFSTSLIIAIATITKPAGFYIGAIIIGIYVLIQLLNNKCNKKENIKKFLRSKEFKIIVILILVVTLTFLSWKIFVKINSKYNKGVRGNDASRVGDSSINYTIKSILTTTFGYYEENHDSADSNNDLIPKIYALYATMAPIRVTLYGVIAIIGVSSIILYKYVIKEENKKKYANAVIGLTVGLAIYIIFLQLSYILKFSKEEMLGHNGLNRYLPTYLLGMIYFIVAIAIKNMEESKTRKVNYLIMLSIIIAFTNLQSIANVTITSGIDNIQSIEYCNNGRIPANKIDKKIEENAKIISISQNEKTNIFNWMIKYYLYPNHEVEVYNNINEEMITKIKEKIINENIQYIYIVTPNEKLNKAIEIMDKTEESKLKENTLYKIEIKANDIKLKEETLD